MSEPVRQVPHTIQVYQGSRFAPPILPSPTTPSELLTQRPHARLRSPTLPASSSVGVSEFVVTVSHMRLPVPVSAHVRSRRVGLE